MLGSPRGTRLGVVAVKGSWDGGGFTLGGLVAIEDSGGGGGVAFCPRTVTLVLVVGCCR